MSSTAPSFPLVSCIMPTADRRRFVPLAIRAFLAQDYANKELVVLDDGLDSVAGLMPCDPRVRYLRLGERRTLGAKRNECVRESRGNLIMHWDDDDWMAPHRISYQVAALLREDAEVCGLRRMLFHDLGSGENWLYDYPADRRPWLAGGSLLYTRDFWQRSPFPDLQVGSDTHFIWSQSLERAVVLPDYHFYVALIHPGNTSPKDRECGYWSRWDGDLTQIMGDALSLYRPSPAAPGAPITSPQPPTYSIIMVVHNALAMVQLATLRTLQHSAGQDARLVVVDNASNDGAEIWLRLLAQRGVIDLIRSDTNLGHGPAIELARRDLRSPYLVTLDSDAFPLVADWLSRLRDRLDDSVKIAGIRHHRDYIHPSCLMIARATLEEFRLSFLNEKDQPSQLDVAERMSCEIKRRGYQIAGIERTAALRRGSVAEPVYLGATYDGLVYHQWYTTRAAVEGGGPVDDVPLLAIEQSLRELFEQYHAEARDITVVVGVRAAPDDRDRRRNMIACLQALNLQDLPRWRYRIVVVEQDREARLEQAIAPLADRYIFAFNPGPYNRGWAFNVGAAGARGVLCLIDADLLVPPTFLISGLAVFQEGRRALLPYDEIVYLDAPSTEQAIQDRLQEGGMREEHAYGGRVFATSQGGCIWVEAALYAAIGGHNEEFRGWGREDREFWDRLARATQIHRLPGRLLHLDHPRPPMDDSCAQANQQLYDRLSRSPDAVVSRTIGDPNRYQGEDAPAAVPRHVELGRRAWENWHHWSADRIERIVHDEQRRADHLSSRGQLAALLTGLGNSLLDVGCGSGALWPRLECYRPRFSWAGVDVTREMVDVARRLFPHVPVYHADAAALPVEDGSFAVVLLRHVLEHLPSWLMEQALAEAMRVARSAVVIAFYLPPVSQGPRQTREVGDHFLETQWTVEDLTRQITAAGWVVCARTIVAGTPNETDVVWILAPEGPACPTTEEAPPESLKVSIIMPTYRRPHTILRTVATIQAQTHANWEMIVVDNAGDADYHFTDPRIHLYRYTDRASASAARNYGLQYATGDLVCFFDDDDEMFPHYLARFVAAFATSPRANMVRCGMIVGDRRVNFSFATPECCLRRQFAAPAWTDHPAHDQQYFRNITVANQWSETSGDIVVIPEALCRANADAHGGLRAGAL